MPHIELYGIPRQRAGTDNVEIESNAVMRLGDVIRQLAQRFPPLAADCFDGERLRAGYVANLGGERFIADPDEQIGPSDSILILSADAGGT